MGVEETKSVSDNGGEEITNDEVKKCCSDCKTTKTPLWRGGPAGPKSLCNACGIRYRKKRGDNLGSEKKKGSTTSSAAAASTATSASSGSEGDEVKLRLKIVFTRSGVVKKQRCQRRRRRRVVIGEEEQAAFCLMALSCGSLSVFA